MDIEFSEIIEHKQRSFYFNYFSNYSRGSKGSIGHALDKPYPNVK